MTKNKKIIPELRFPEFENEGSWTKKRLADFDDLPSGDGDWILSKDISLNGSYKIVQLSSIGFGSFKEKVLKTISEETFAELNGTPIRKGDLLINRMVDANKINCCIFPYENKYVTSVDVCWIRQNDSINNYFLMSLLSTGDNQIKLLSLSSGAGRVRISKSNLFDNFFFPLPKNKEEQQKIASCLSSLDEVIDVHTKKLELLIDHKKGLMQNLFPQEGEKVPKLRFKEFENDGEWKENKIEKICTKVSDGIHTTPQYDNAGEYYFINGNNLVQSKIVIDENTKKINEIEYHKHKKELGDNTILLSINGTIGNIAFYSNEQVILGKSACYINIKPSLVNKEFFAYQLNTKRVIEYFNSQVTGAVIKNLSLKTIKETFIFIPKIEEQKKIGFCLSSLDELITVQMDKIQQLKLHKKGLMQGLFPKIID